MIEVKRDYKISNAELMIFASNLVGTLNRDAVIMGDYGVTALDLTDFATLGNSFEDFPPDEFYQADVGIKAEIKDATRAQLISDTRKITNRAIIKWGENSPHYKKFGVVGLNGMADMTLFAKSRLVVKTATILLTELASEGLTQIIIDAYAALVQQYEDEINEVDLAVEIRDVKTQERTILGNELYSSVSKYCRIGKTIWADDESKYNDYVIYPTVHSGLSKPQNLTAVVDPANPPNVEIDFDVVENAINYKLYFSETTVGHPSGTFEQNGESATNHFDTPLITGKRNHWKVRAFSIDKNSDYSSEVYVDG